MHSEELFHEYGFRLNAVKGRYDGVIVAVNHEPYLPLQESYFKSILQPKGVLVDVKGIYKNQINLNLYYDLY